MKIRSFLFIAFWLLCGVSARAQDSTARFVRYGIFGTAAVNLHNRHFALPYPGQTGTNSETISGVTTSIGWSLGVLAELPLVDKFGCALRLSVSGIGVKSFYFEDVALAINGNFVQTQLEHTLDMSDLGLLGSEVYLTYRPFEMLNVYAGSVFYNSGNWNFTKTVRFPDTSLGLSSFSLPYQWKGNISHAQGGMNILHIGFAIGAAYEIPLDNSNQWLCTVEAFYTHFLGSLLQAPDVWTLDHLRAGVSLRYAPFATNR